MPPRRASLRLSPKFNKGMLQLLTDSGNETNSGSSIAHVKTLDGLGNNSYL